MSLLQDAHSKVLDEFVVLKGVLESAKENKVSGRLDLTKMNLAHAKWLGYNGIYQSHIQARDVLYWFEDYFILTKDKNVKVKPIIDAQIKLYKE